MLGRAKRLTITAKSSGKDHEALADELLVTTNMKLEEVSTRLGYSEPSSFIHAYKRWNGVSPSEFRLSRSRA